MRFNFLWLFKLFITRFVLPEHQQASRRSGPERKKDKKQRKAEEEMEKRRKRNEEEEREKKKEEKQSSKNKDFDLRTIKHKLSIELDVTEPQFRKLLDEITDCCVGEGYVVETGLSKLIVESLLGRQGCGTFRFTCRDDVEPGFFIVTMRVSFEKTPFPVTVLMERCSVYIKAFALIDVTEGSVDYQNPNVWNVLKNSDLTLCGTVPLVENRRNPTFDMNYKEGFSNYKPFVGKFPLSRACRSLWQGNILGFIGISFHLAEAVRIRELYNILAADGVEERLIDSEIMEIVHRWGQDSCKIQKHWDLNSHIDIKLPTPAEAVEALLEIRIGRGQYCSS